MAKNMCVKKEIIDKPGLKLKLIKNDFAKKLQTTRFSPQPDPSIPEFLLLDKDDELWNAVLKEYDRICIPEDNRPHLKLVS